MFNVELPCPPSSNRIWRMARGRTIKSKEYRQWLKSCHAYVWFKHQEHEMYTCPIKVSIIYIPPSKVRKDLDNILKPILDLLELAEVVENDRLVHQIDLRLDPPHKSNDRVLVSVEEL